MARGFQPLADPRSKEAVGFRLRSLREGLGLTQAQMAARIGSATSGQMWGNYEAGDRRPEIDTAYIICAKFNVTIAWIYDGQELLAPQVLEIIRLGELRIAEARAKKAKKKQKDRR